MSGTVIIVSSVRWDFTWQRHHDIASGLAERGYEVIFIEPLLRTWLPRLSSITVLLRQHLSPRSAHSIYIPQSKPPGVRIIRPIGIPDKGLLGENANRLLFMPRLVKNLRGIISSRPLVLINYLPFSYAINLQKILEPDVAIYDCVWNWDLDPYSRGANVRESELLQITDIVFADSNYHLERMKLVHENVVRVLPAVRYDIFSDVNHLLRSPQMQPKCAYFGDVGENIDVQLLKKVSQVYDLKVIGPVRKSREGFSTRTEFIGPIEREKIPQYLKDVNVLLLPYRKANHTSAVIPAKTFECLATGIPTVVTGLPNLLEYSDVFYICQTDEEFIEAIANAVDEPETAKELRLEVAKRNSWKFRLEEIQTAIDRCLRDKR